MKSKKRYSKMTMQKVEKFMRDPVYMGILVYGKTSVNLMEIYDFAPMISKDEFFKINKL